MEYKDIAQKGIYKAKRSINNAERIIKEKERKEKNLEDINAFLSLKRLENENLKDFETRLNDIKADASFDKLFEDKSTRSAYKDGFLSTKEGLQIKIEDIEKIRQFRKMSTNPVVKEITQLLLKEGN
jgi:hypothetical protein|tara:strand:- start:477 stop:857 length:381 start_codon:yes stop_codon:yes gene_type:complete